MDDSKYFVKFDTYSAMVCVVVNDPLCYAAIGWLASKKVEVVTIGQSSKNKAILSIVEEHIPRLSDEDRAEFVLRFC